MTRTRVLLADDHRAMLDRVVRVLGPDFDLVGTVGDGQALVEAANALKPDLIVVDISMPKLTGIDATRKLKEAGSEARVVMLTVHEDPDFVRAAFEAGATGFVLKTRLTSDLTLAIDEVLAGRSFVSPSVSRDEGA